MEVQVILIITGSKVFYTQLIDYKEIPGYQAASDIFLSPSSAETFGLSTIEVTAARLSAQGINVK